MAIYKIGDYATWTYKSPKANDRNPKVLILHDNWEGHVHGLNFNYLTNDEINYLRMVLNYTFAENEIEPFSKKNPKLANDYKRMRNVYKSLNINSPYDFYQRFVRGFIQPKGYDPYRLYKPEYIQAPRVLRKARYFTSNNPLSAMGRYIDTFKYRRGSRFL